MEFKTLENTGVEQILVAFNKSFHNYFVNIHLSQYDLEEKLKADGFDPDLSVGVFDEGQLVAFILHSSRNQGSNKIVYNGGTGVIPSHRGQGLTHRMYEFIKPKLKAEGATECLLEVINENMGALKSYQSAGFEISKKIDCLKGHVDHGSPSINPNIEELKDWNWPLMESFWDWQATWQHQRPSIENAKDSVHSIGYFESGKMLAYAIYNPQTRRVLQFAVDKDHRRRGIGKSLFSYIASKLEGELFALNIDVGATETLSFLNKIGLESAILQYEMRLNLRE